jgi:RHS repeat-associated protein
MDEFFARNDVAAGTTTSLLTDTLGSTIALADSAGIVQTENTYEPFGKTTTTGFSNTNPLRYTGREDDGTSLYYHRARYYDPALQRFTQEDPILHPGNGHAPYMVPRLISRPSLLHPYAYVGNNPINFTDPSGLGPCEDRFSECLAPIGKRLFECRKAIIFAAMACQAGCVPICLTQGPFFPECFVVCEAGCAAGLTAGYTACNTQAWAARALCAWDYYRCKKDRCEPLW